MPFAPSYMSVYELDTDTLSAPVNMIAPFVYGVKRSSERYSVSRGVWQAQPAATLTYQWKKDGVNIAGATNDWYTLQAGDVSADITCAVTATNSQGSATVLAGPFSSGVITIPDVYPTFNDPIIGAIGDSLIAHMVEGANPGTTNMWETNAGELGLAKQLHQRFRCDNWPFNTTTMTPSNDRYTDGAIQAISGSNAASHRAMLQNYLLPKHPQILFYRPSVNNSVGTGTGPATLAYFLETIQIAMDAGVYVLVGTMCPWVDDPSNAFNGSDNNINRAYINNALRAWAAANLPKSKGIFLDFDIPLDPTNSGWTARSNMSDYIHLGTQGALKCARYINTKLDLIIPARNYALELWNGGNNKFPYGILAGNGGVTANGSGSTPTGMRTQRGGAGSSVLTLSTEANAQTGGLTRVFSIAPAGTATTGEYYQLAIGTTGDFTVAGQTGQWVRSIAEVEVMGNDALLVPQLWANGRRVGYENGWSGGIGDAQQQTYWLVTDATQVSSDTANLSIRLYPNSSRALANTGSAPLVAKVKRLGYYFVNNPRLAYA